MANNLARNRWEQLGRNQIGLAVEGDDDKKILEAFLNAGQNAGHWQNWRSRLLIVPIGGLPQLLNELKIISRNDIHGLIDRDWRDEDEIKALQDEYPRLHVLERAMIENFLIRPDEFIPFLHNESPENKNRLRSKVSSHIQKWLEHGALRKALHKNNAHYFCRTSEGYPEKLLSRPASEDDIRENMGKWIEHLNPDHLIKDRRNVLESFRMKDETTQYYLCLDGKRFFQQVVVTELNALPLAKKGNVDEWVKRLLGEIERSTLCPTDLTLIFQSILSQT